MAVLVPFYGMRENVGWFIKPYLSFIFHTSARVFCQIVTDYIKPAIQFCDTGFKILIPEMFEAADIFQKNPVQACFYSYPCAYTLN